MTLTCEKRVQAIFYRSKAGAEPVRNWLKALTKEERLKIGTDIKTVEFGWPIGMPTCRPMQHGLFEVRSNLGNRTARVIFCFHERRMILLHGFIKRTQKTPTPDLELALARKRNLEEPS